MPYHHVLEPQGTEESQCPSRLPVSIPLIHSFHFDLFKFILIKRHILQGMDALCMVHSLEGVYVCHVTSGCHGNFSLLLN